MEKQLIVVTGGAGFLGRHIARRLASEGYRVVGVGHGVLSLTEQKESGYQNWYTSSLNADVMGLVVSQSGKPYGIIHAAGAGSVGRVANAPLSNFYGTVAATAELLEALRLHAPEARLVMLSSAAVYGHQKSAFIAESAPRNPVSVYGLHKALSEDLCLDAASRWALNLSIVRFFSVYGEGLKKQLFWDIVQKIRGGKTVTLMGSGQETRDFIHVNDAADIVPSLLQRADPQPLILNGGTGIATTIESASRALVEASGISSRIHFTGEIVESDPRHLVADSSRLKDFGLTPKVDLCAGIKSYWGWALNRS